MPAKSAAQQKAAGAALAAKRGETSPSSLRGAAKEMYSSMSEQELEEFPSTKRKGKPRARLEIEVALLTGATRLFATIKPRGAIYTQLGLMVQG